MRTIMMAGFLAAAPCVAIGAPAQCPQIMQGVNDIAASITRDAETYWDHRSTYVALRNGPKHDLPEVAQLAEKKESLAEPLREAMAGKLEDIKAGLTEAQSKNCAPSSELSAIRELAFARAKRVRIDRFPKD